MLWCGPPCTDYCPTLDREREREREDGSVAASGRLAAPGSLLAGRTCRSANTGAQYEIPQSVASICHCPHHCFLLRHFSPVVTLTAAASNQPTRPTTSQTIPSQLSSDRRRSQVCKNLPCLYSKALLSRNVSQKKEKSFFLISRKRIPISREKVK